MLDMDSGGVLSWNDDNLFAKKNTRSKKIYITIDTLMLKT